MKSWIPFPALQNYNRKKMFPSDTLFGVFLISQLCIGVLGNSVLFMVYAYTFLVKPHLKKHIDPIVMHLLLSNALTILFTLIPDIASTMGVRHLLNEVGCQTVLFSYRVTRGVSICTTSLLSTYQAITVSPSNSKWMRIKFKLSTWTWPLFLFFWILNMVVYFHVIETVTAIRNFTLVGPGYVHAYCQNRNYGKHASLRCYIPMFVRDLVFVFLMVSTSLYMVNLLYRHSRRAHYIRSPRLSSQASPEHKATRTILLLVGCFVLFYLANNCLTLYAFYARLKIPRLEGLSGALSSCFPTICPFVLMKSKRIVSQFTSSFSMKLTGSETAFNV